MLKIGSIYTIYSKRRGGAELFCERMFLEFMKYSSEIELHIFCNKKAFEILQSIGIKNIYYVKYLDNQFIKAFWLEYIAKVTFSNNYFSIFWNPSGANHFPGKWKQPTVSTILDIGEFFIKNKYSFIKTVYRKFICIPRTIRRSNKIITISSTTLSDINKEFGVTKNTEVIYLSVDPWSNKNEKDNIIDENVEKYLNEIKPFLLCVGRVDFIGKGIDIILDGYLKLHKGKYILPDLVFVGSLGEEGNELVKFIDSSKSSNIHYFGRVSNRSLEELYNASKLCLLASRYEGFGITMLEAFKREKPILCSDLPVLREIGGNAPIYFKSGSTQDFILKLVEILDNRIDLKKNIAAGINNVSKYSWEKTAQKYLTVFETVNKESNV